MRRLAAATILVCMVVVLAGSMIQPAVAQDSSIIYIVQPGDNLERIAQRFGVSAQAIMQANGITDSNLLFVGQRLVIPQPSAQATATPFPVPTATSSTVIIATLVPTGPPPPEAPPLLAYVVQPGDTLESIAARFNIPVAVVLELNNLTSTDTIFPGQVLRIPASPATPLPALPGQVVPNTASNVGFVPGITVELAGQELAAVTRAVNDLGLRWVKFRVHWDRYEPTPGDIDFSALDAQVNALVAANLNVLLTVSHAPGWARNTALENGPPTDFNTYARFVGALAGRYAGRVRAYEIWEQPNIRREWNGLPLSAASYVELLRAAFVAIKQADSSAIVVSAGLAPTGLDDGANAINDRSYLRQMYAAGLAEVSDVIGAQPGGWANPPDSSCCAASPGVTAWFADRSFYFKDTLADYRQIMVENNDSSTFIWVTEFGWGSSAGVLADRSMINESFGYVAFTSEAQQAQYTVRGFEIGRALGYVGPMFLANLNACQVIGNNPMMPGFERCYFSLLSVEGRPRPAYEALKAAPK